jgi:hypothetical protein
MSTVAQVAEVYRTAAGDIELILRKDAVRLDEAAWLRRAAKDRMPALRWAYEPVGFTSAGDGPQRQTRHRDRPARYRSLTPVVPAGGPAGQYDPSHRFRHRYSDQSARGGPLISSISIPQTAAQQS